jgi:transcription-repair coupling factor (superfamily II helicase)
VTPRQHRVVEALLTTPVVRALAESPPAPGARLRIPGNHGSSATATAAALHQALPGRILVVVAPDPDQAARAEADLVALLGEDAALLYPQGEARFYGEETDPRIGGLRVEAVEALFSGRARLFVTTPRGLQERAALPDRLARLRLELETGEEIGFQLLVEELEVMGYERVPLVEEVGQFAVRGGIVDVYSLGSSDPVRLEFWGDEITSIRRFRVADQRSTTTESRVHLLPAAFRSPVDEVVALPAPSAVEDETLPEPAPAPAASSGTEVRSFLEVLPDDALVVDLVGEGWPEGFRRNEEQAARIRSDRSEGGERLPPVDRILLPWEDAIRKLQRHAAVALVADGRGDLNVGALAPPVVERKMPILVDFLREEASRGHATVILCDNEGQVERLEEILTEQGRLLPGVQVGVGTLEAGFRLPAAEPPLNVLTDHEIFRRSRRVRSGRSFRGAVALESLAQLTPGDYVVHMEHGIGQFRGLEQLEVAGTRLEVVAIEYAGGEVLRVPVYRMDLIERWVGEADADEPPQVHRIGGKRWKTLRRKTEEAIARLMRELVELYAEREVAEGHAFAPDTRWQREMEASFLYEDTPDQARATAEVKRDMEARRPMDRLVCGDVGFGKTEVAIRAAFKAVQDGKQVAVLAPTTILAEQHRRTFEERLADFPVRVGALSRFRSAAETAEIVGGLQSGEVDIVIGTHRLLSTDIRFRSLGLLIIDEEQRFGVKHKEKLKRFRASVDVLTLTATPIPRTLQFSLAGLRNLSLIRTPPRDRLAVHTQSIPWSDGLLSEIIGREMDRGGQVYFLHNRVETIHTMAERVHRLAPEARVEVAHGQMGASELDRVMHDFIEGRIDVLVCSSIVENGLDVPNANTLIVDRADRFGLAQLYQIRGRVGRSDRRAWCYLVTPDAMTEEARQRLAVLEHHTELGSGYQVALRDLELRGAGSLLGADQSGFAHAVGMDTYLRLLEDAVRRIRAGEEGGRDYPEPEVSLPGSAFLPDGYVSDSSQKLHLYRRLSKVESRSEVEALREELADRYGPLPVEVERLLDAHVLRLQGKMLGIERILVRDREGRLTFRAAATPRMSTLEAPFRNRQVEVEVKRMIPLSLALRPAGPEPLTRTLIRALDAWLEAREEAA